MACTYQSGEENIVFSNELTQRIRSQFPRIERDIENKKRIFFDNAAGTCVLCKVAEAQSKVCIDLSANIHASFDESQKGSSLLFEGRKAIADLINASSPLSIVYGESATSLLFKLSYAIGRELSGEENIVTTFLEHYANVSPWEELGRRHLVSEVRYAHLKKEDGTLDMDNLRSLVDKKTRVITVTGSSNLIGTKPPLEEIKKVARKVGAYFVVDGVGRIPHGPVDVQALDCDFLVFSGYKFFNVRGSFLYGKEDLLSRLESYKIAPASKQPPEKWEWGTQSQTAFAGMRAVIEYLVWLADQVGDTYENKFTSYSGRKRSLKVAMNAIEKYEMRLSKAMLIGSDENPGLAGMPDVEVYGITDQDRFEERNSVFAFKIHNMNDEDVDKQLWKKHRIALRTGDLWSKTPEDFGVKSMIRASLAHYNTVDEINTLLRALRELTS